MESLRLFRRFLPALILPAMMMVVESRAQSNVSVYATGLISPIGIEIDDQGRLWVGEEGTGNNDSRVSVITTDGQVHPFLTGLPSELVEGDPLGAEHVYLDASGDLLIMQGEGSNFLSESVLTISTAGFSPGDTSRRIDDLKAIHKIGRFTLSQGAASTNTYALAIGPDENLYIVDAGLNGIVRLDRCTGNLSVFATFDPIPNPTTEGPPFMDAVPTGIVYTGDKFYVGLFVGFPFLPDSSRIVEVDLDGNVSVLKTGLTSIVDVAVDPRDGNVVFLQFARWEFPFVPNSGGVFKLKNGAIDTVAFGLNFPAGLRFAPNGDLFVSSFADGQILKITFSTTAVETRPNGALPQAFGLNQNYPNPFNPSTTINFEVPKAAQVIMKIYDTLGREVRTLFDGRLEAGAHNKMWDGKDHNGISIGSGVYFVKMTSDGFESSKRMLLVK